MYQNLCNESMEENYMMQPMKGYSMMNPVQQKCMMNPMVGGMMQPMHGYPMDMNPMVGGTMQQMQGCPMMQSMQGNYMMNPALQNALALIKEAIKDEKHDELFYDYLLKNAPSKDQRDIITSIRNDERKHFAMFKMIYKFFTGEDITVSNGEDFKPPKSYIDGIVEALFGELKAVEKYREIYKGLPTRYFRDMLFEIITDEIKHSAKWNYLYTLNRTGGKDKCRGALMDYIW